MLRVAIIGAGAAGLCSARHAKDLGFECDVIEMKDRIGGTWIYTDEVGNDNYGYPIYSAMYEGLMTNLPKEIMGFPDYPVPPRRDSYLPQKDILAFLNSYADHFDLKPLMKFNCIVKEIRPQEGNTWKLTYVHKPTGEEVRKVYDAVLVCNGHYNKPKYPQIPGEEMFKGEKEHSHDYRNNKPYKDKRVLIIGSGPSGLDLTLQLSRVTQYVAISHHSKIVAEASYPENVLKKPDVERILDHETVEFVDGTTCVFDCIVYCTGYTYDFPFLHDSCGIKVEGNMVQPLYKHMVNIERPTMCFVGLPFQVCTFHLFDLQARYICNYLDRVFELPSKEEMLRHTENEIAWRKEKGLPKKCFHMLGTYEQSYYDDLTAEAGLKPIPPVITNIRIVSTKRLASDPLNFRNDRYVIVDDEKFIRLP